jgi:hypothetical protein
VPKSEDGDSDDRIDRLDPAVRHGERSAHHAEAEAADRGGHHEAVLGDPAPERKHAEQDGERQADLVDDRGDQYPARRGEHGEDDRGRQAMDEAQPGQRHRHPVHRSVCSHLREHEPVILLKASL